jgi:NADH dehydrogenase
MRQGWTAAKNLAAALHGMPLGQYRHRDLGLVVDLGGADAVSKPVGVELTGLPAQVVARGYHLAAQRTFPARLRTMTNWTLNALAGYDFVRTGFLAGRPTTLKDFERSDVYLTPDLIASHTSKSTTR